MSFRTAQAGDADLSWRTIKIKPDSWDEESRSVACTIATDKPNVSVNSRTGQGVLEVWRMDGAEFEDRAPLMDCHQRGSVRQVLGSVRDISIKDGEMTGRLHISEAEPNVATKVKEGHIRSVSGGIQPLEGETIAKGKAASVRGVPYTAPKDRDLNILTRWRLREVSLVPIGADPSAKIRSTGTVQMNENVRKFLESIGLRAESTPEEAKAFYDELPEVTRKLADNWNPSVELNTRGTPKPKAKPATEKTESDTDLSMLSVRELVLLRHEMKTNGETDSDAEFIAEIDAEFKRRGDSKTLESQRQEILKEEQTRRSEIKRLGEGAPEEMVRKFSDDISKTVEDAKDAFLEFYRTGRSDPATPAIHSRSKEADCTAPALGYGLALRNCDGEKLLNMAASYQPVAGDGGAGTTYALRRAYDRDAHKKAFERLLNEADRYRSMSLVDIGREACRLDGKPVPLTLAPEEVFRTAVSGSALNVIFTTNINAEFQSGYMDYADSTQGWVSEADKGNFLTNEVDTMGKFGTLKKVVKGRPAEHLNISDWKESYKLARYGGQFTVDEIDFINDRFGALESESPRDMGLTAAQLRPNLVYAILLANAVLDVDGVALFDDTTHANYKAASSGDGGPLAADSLQAAIVRMAKQRINGRVLNIKPRFLIVPQDLKFTAGILLKSAERVISTSDGGTYNPLKELEINLVVDDRIGVGGVIDPTTDTARVGTATNFFLAARPGEEGAKTIEVGYRRGTGRAPLIRSFVLDKGQWGMGWDINMDIGGKALDFRAVYKSKGAA